MHLSGLSSLHMIHTQLPRLGWLLTMSSGFLCSFKLHGCCRCCVSWCILCHAPCVTQQSAATSDQYGPTLPAQVTTCSPQRPGSLWLLSSRPRLLMVCQSTIIFFIQNNYVHHYMILLVIIHHSKLSLHVKDTDEKQTAKKQNTCIHNLSITCSLFCLMLLPFGS